MSWRGVIVASVLLGVTHLTFSPLHRVSEQLDEESEASGGTGIQAQASHSVQRRLRSRAERRDFQRLCLKHQFAGRVRHRVLEANHPLPGQFSAALAARNGFGGPLLA